jgi:hypothetical protein
MRINKYIAKRQVAGALLILFMSYFACITLFSHSHVINGIKIVHSHPYSGAPEEHTHTAAEVEVINHLTFFISLAAFIASGIVIFVEKLRTVSKPSISVPLLNTYLYHLLRAPPFC